MSFFHISVQQKLDVEFW